MAPTTTSRWADLDGPTHYVEFCADPTADPDDDPHDRADHPPPLVLVHGLSGSYANWLAVAPALAGSGRRVLALDLPGHGLTRPAGRDVTLAGHARVLAGFMDDVAGGRAVLVGNSLGGLLALQQAATRPATAEALVLLAPALPLGRARVHPITLAGFAGYAVPGLGEAIVGSRRRRFTPEQLVAQTLWMCCADPAAVPRPVVDAHVDLVRRRAGYRQLDAAFLTSARSLLRRLARPQMLARMLDEVTCPVLLVHGTRDRLVPVAAARAVAVARPSWRYEELAGVGHVPQLEAADRTAVLLLDWLGG